MREVWAKKAHHKMNHFVKNLNATYENQVVIREISHMKDYFEDNSGGALICKYEFINKNDNHREVFTFDSYSFKVYMLTALEKFMESHSTF